MSTGDDKVLNIYYEHYKDTFTLSKEAQICRNKNFVILCVLEAISALMIYNPNLICEVLNDVVTKELEITIRIGNSIIQSLIWMVIAFVLVRYVQDSLYVERQYGYIGKLEKRISLQMRESGENDLFCREGDAYLDNYPMVLNIIDLFYKLFCPILFTVINIAHIIAELRVGSTRMLLICDIATCTAIIIITWFYFFQIHPRITSWAMKCPPIKAVAETLRKWLKEV